jgi:hypothetical protein
MSGWFHRLFGFAEVAKSDKYGIPIDSSIRMHEQFDLSRFEHEEVLTSKANNNEHEYEVLTSKANNRKFVLGSFFTSSLETLRR